MQTKRTVFCMVPFFVVNIIKLIGEGKGSFGC